jgi:ABC-type uncharacterized transport system ATPase subunit
LLRVGGPEFAPDFGIGVEFHHCPKMDKRSVTENVIVGHSSSIRPRQQGRARAELEISKHQLDFIGM